LSREGLSHFEGRFEGQDHYKGAPRAFWMIPCVIDGWAAHRSAIRWLPYAKGQLEKPELLANLAWTTSVAPWAEDASIMESEADFRPWIGACFQ
jgi:hypothetical protein